MASTALFHDPCPKCKGDLFSSVARWGLLLAQCTDCGYEPSEEEYKKLCDEDWEDSDRRKEVAQIDTATIRVEGTCKDCLQPVETLAHSQEGAKVLQGTDLAICEVCGKDLPVKPNWKRIR